MVKPSASSRLAERASVSNSGEVMGAMWLGYGRGSRFLILPMRNAWGGGPPEGWWRDEWQKTRQLPLHHASHGPPPHRFAAGRIAKPPAAPHIAAPPRTGARRIR